MNKRIALAFVLILSAATAWAGCAGPRVERISPDRVTDISGRWNDTDSQQVARAVVGDCLAQPWLDEWKRANPDRRPVVIVGAIINKSHEHINVQTFMKDIERALINSQKVRFVSSREERGELRRERSDQHEGWTAEETRAGVGQEIGANFMMKGSLNTIVDELESSKAVFYQANIELHDLTTNEIVWLGEHKIKKIIDKDSVKW
ncbi:MAG: penicillin-binding protein activator LpoB [Myxococcales bacterium]|nr:MAG: penicillin-binding protein activator LpoB [Myxococcales bacterium]